jgi:hypothetical protein
MQAAIKEGFFHGENPSAFFPRLDIEIKDLAFKSARAGNSDQTGE